MEKEVKIPWWKESFVYQIYPLSFCDSNGDGIGDIPGIISKLDYIKNLGVQVIWLSPVFVSPMEDNGYDIANYDEVNPMFGTKADLKRLVDEVHRRGMKIISDVVVNHTSNQHPWFLDALKNPSSPYRDFYIFRNTINDLTSVFSGSAWEKNPYRPGEYYYHLFAASQPDLNWHHPKVRDAMCDMLNRWLDFGFDGFRMDVIDAIGKDVDKKKFGFDGQLKQYLREINERCFKGRDLLNVGELGGCSVEQASELTDEKKGYLTMGFQFSHLGLDEVPGKGKWALRKLDVVEFKKHFAKLDDVFSKRGWNAIFMSNHDQPRPVSRYGQDQGYRVLSMQMLMVLFYGFRGTPFVYQGDEIGMTNYPFQSIEEFKDIESLNYYRESIAKKMKPEGVLRSLKAKGRDNARTPMQWDDTANSGFSTGKPWLKVNPNYPELNVALDRMNPKGVYYFLKRYIAMRKRHRAFIDGTFRLVLAEHPSVVAYLRENNSERVLVLCNMSSRPQRISLRGYKTFEPLILNQPMSLTEKMVLPPYFAGVFAKVAHGHH